ncbi:DUF7563 family protein [Halegenticoccus soli]|uniref:DUF7563 family protein n=1 Tax=Halegenticoccus soli TaxID=1985678 RepID=UPI000C6CA6A8|nr:hypothetical protein [Halegenticoccus soli]
MSSRTNSGAGAQSTCKNCGAFVTRRFARVYGNNADEVYGCLNCQRARDLREGNHLDARHKRATT